MLLQRIKSTESSYKSQILECLNCDFQQSGGHKNWYCYQCDQLFFSKTPTCSSPMSRRQSKRKQSKDDEPLELPKQESLQSQPIPVSPAITQPREQHVQNFDAVSRPAPYDFGPYGASQSAGYLPFAYNHGLTMPSVDQFEPRQGTVGMVVTVYLRSSRDLSLNSGPNLTVLFGDQRVQSQLFPAGRRNDEFLYTIVFWTPWVDTKSWAEVPVPLYLSINDATQNTVPPALFGYFRYHLPVESYAVAPAQESLSQRSTSSISAIPYSSPVNTVAHGNTWLYDSHFQQTASHGMPVTSGPSNEYQMPHIRSDLRSASTPYSEPSTVATNLRHGPSLRGADDSIALDLTERTARTYPPVTTTARINPTPTLQFTAPSNSNATDNFKTMQNVALGTSMAEVPSSTRAPPLRKPVSHSQLNIESTSQHFNPYSFPKATLQIQGDLNDMLKDWTAEEKETRRRLVVFDRTRSGSIINASFRAIPVANWDPDDICVSCIWWQEKGEGFITSVDLISLLESMIGLRFTLQEKNRIRRNLEGFKPYTIGKSKPFKDAIPPDVEEFFKVIMGLGEPKPRSIEKDVKVFPWKALATAMKKVVDKYSASYASTAGTLHPSFSSARSEGEESSQRPSASQSERASSSADPDFETESTRRAPLVSAPSAPDPLMTDSVLASESISTWQSSGIASSSYPPPVSTTAYSHYFPTSTSMPERAEPGHPDPSWQYSWRPFSK